MSHKFKSGDIVCVSDPITRIYEWSGRYKDYITAGYYHKSTLGKGIVIRKGKFSKNLCVIYFFKIKSFFEVEEEDLHLVSRNTNNSEL